MPSGFLKPGPGGGTGRDGLAFIYVFCLFQDLSLPLMVLGGNENVLLVLVT